jgi:hypothetical protein
MSQEHPCDSVAHDRRGEEGPTAEDSDPRGSGGVALGAQPRPGPPFLRARPHRDHPLLRVARGEPVRGSAHLYLGYARMTFGPHSSSTTFRVSTTSFASR